MDSDKSPGLVTLSLAEAAERLKASPGFVGRLVREGDIPACKVGRAWVLREADLSRYLENQIEARAALRRCRHVAISLSSHSCMFRRMVLATRTECYRCWG